jgi:polyisoprenoid-binding protein YceI
MKQLTYAVLIGATIMLSAFTIKNNSIWKITDDYSVKAKTNKFDAIFKGLIAEIDFDESNLATSKITASIDASSINTGNGMRNKHAKQGLEADKYSTIKFESVTIQKKDNGFEAIGKLTIKDVTKEIKLPFTFTRNANNGVFNGKFSVVPADYNVKKTGTPDLFEIELNIPVTK